MKSYLTRFFKDKNHVAGKGSLFAGLAVSIILLYVVNNLRYMGITQFTEDKLVSCMWSVNLIFGLAIVGNFLLLISRPVWFFYLVQTLICVAGVDAFYFVYTIYPFNLESSFQNQLIKVVIIIITIIFFALFAHNFYRLGLYLRFNLSPVRTRVPVEYYDPEAEQPVSEFDADLHPDSPAGADTEPDSSHPEPSNPPEGLEPEDAHKDNPPG